ncbi:MAG: hypothetical protein BMS9Abin13_608 [Patescibacteria group bacterium]|nr:MAG: hypothetical protein BMS9Abin13_608 [Patescibacteria group bacterium]
MEEKDNITYFAQTDARNKKIPFGIKTSDRTRHVYVIGKTGMGKSTLLENMAVQDIKNGEGMAFVDPHGKTADLLLDYIPEERIKDVVYFAPFDIENPISFNIMEDVGSDKRHLVVTGLMSAFKKIWIDMWSARMEYILTNILLALLEYPNSTLLGVNRMLTDKDYRKKVVDNITDPSTRSFWVDEYAKYTDRYTQEATPAIQNKVGQLTANPLIRNIIGQPKSSFDIRKMMDEKKILIINLSKGQIGEGNANLLGSMLITKIYLAAMSRADLPTCEAEKLPNFYVYVDEFQSFANESFADILSEARKYKLNLTIAHQYIEQMSDEVRAAVFGNVGTMITFRVGAYDADVLEKEFAPVFTAEDLVNLGVFQIYLKLMIGGVSSHPFSATTLPPISPPEISYREKVIGGSRASFAHPRSAVEEEIKKWYQPVAPPVRPPVRRTQTGLPMQSGERDTRHASPRDTGPPVRSTQTGGRYQRPHASAQGYYTGGREQMSRRSAPMGGNRAPESSAVRQVSTREGSPAQTGRTQTGLPVSVSRQTGEYHRRDMEVNRERQLTHPRQEKRSPPKTVSLDALKKDAPKFPRVENRKEKGPSENFTGLKEALKKALDEKSNKTGLSAVAPAQVDEAKREETKKASPAYASHADRDKKETHTPKLRDEPRELPRTPANKAPAKVSDVQTDRQKDTRSGSDTGVLKKKGASENASSLPAKKPKEIPEDILRKIISDGKRS